MFAFNNGTEIQKFHETNHAYIYINTISETKMFQFTLFFKTNRT